MGLDMYLYEVPLPAVVTDFYFNDEYEYNQIHYWRKYHSLHHWFRGIFYTRGGGRDKDFNGDVLRLYSDDIDSLEKNFNPLDINEAHHECKEYIQKMRDSIAEGYAVYYNSSW